MTVKMNGKKRVKSSDCGSIKRKSQGGGKGKKMYIANPVYDVVFKYLLDDNKIAKKLLSLIIGKEILTLQYKESEIRNDLKGKHLTLLHLDFSALVKLADGSEQQIIIELQKAKLHTDILRFRRYLGTQYADKNSVYCKNGKNVAMPIFSIYFLGHCLEHTKVPVIKVDRTYYDAATGEQITEKEEFIEGLTHDSMIIQIPSLKSHRRNLLEEVLSVFQPSKGDNMFIDMSEEDYPKEYREVFRRLLQAGAEKKIRETMIIEDEIIAELDDMDRAIAKRDDIIEEKDHLIEEKELALEKSRQAIEEKDKMIKTAIESLARAGNISIEEAEKILKTKPDK